MRTRTALFLAAGIPVALVLAGCSGSAGGDSGPVTITYATAADTAVLNAGEKPIIDAFMKANPEIKVDIQQIPIADYNTTLTTRFRGGDGPDLGRVNHTDIQMFAAGGFLTPMEDAIKANNIDTSALIKGLVKGGQVNGKQMTLPLTTDTRVLFYNPKLLAEHNIQPPATWDDLKTAVSEFAGGSTYGYAFPSDNDYSMAYEAVGPYMKQAEGAILVDKGDAITADAAASDGTVAAVEFLRSLVATGATPPGQDNFSQESIAQLFSQGKLAFFTGGPWMRASIEGMNANLKYGTDYLTIPIPVQHAGEQPGSTAGGWQIGLFKTSKHADAAGKLLAYMMKPENLILLNKKEAFPPLNDGLSTDPWSTDPFYKAFNDTLPGAGLPILPVVRMAEVSAAFEAAVEPLVLDAHSDVKAGLKSFDEKTNSQILK
jgi:ABC-type glycerol-3-phosphate transport system substrate-binding protein